MLDKRIRLQQDILDKLLRAFLNVKEAEIAAELVDIFKFAKDDFDGEAHEQARAAMTEFETLCEIAQPLDVADVEVRDEEMADFGAHMDNLSEEVLGKLDPDRAMVVQIVQAAMNSKIPEASVGHIDTDRRYFPQQSSDMGDVANFPRETDE